MNEISILCSQELIVCVRHYELFVHRFLGCDINETPSKVQSRAPIPASLPRKKSQISARFLTLSGAQSENMTRALQHALLQNCRQNITILLVFLERNMT